MNTLSLAGEVTHFPHDDVFASEVPGRRGHCHVESSPLRKEMMSQEQRVAGKAWKKHGIWEIDGKGWKFMGKGWKRIEVHGKMMEMDGKMMETTGKNHRKNIEES